MLLNINIKLLQNPIYNGPTLLQLHSAGYDEMGSGVENFEDVKVSEMGSMVRNPLC